MTAALPASIDACAAIIRAKSKSFAVASLLLPAEVRAATVVLYAFCRRCDDAIDELGEAAVISGAAPLALAELRTELDSVYAGAPQKDPVLAAFQQVAMRYRIPRRYPEELLLGMEMDVRGTRYRALSDLLLYCYRVAGTVGLMMCHVMGVSHPRALRHAAHLGMAMQLTNICRDVLDDHRLGRLYLPEQLVGESTAERLGRAEVDVRDESVRAPVTRAVRALLVEADGYYRSADRGLSQLSFRCALAVRAARMLYAAIGTRLRLSGYDPLRGRAFTPRSWKVILVLNALLASVFAAPRRLFARFRPVAALTEVRYPEDVLPL
nr:phytoene synthase [uncultured bacterium]ANY58042.1 phytoene synthase [uncultured bacterium]